MICTKCKKQGNFYIVNGKPIQHCKKCRKKVSHLNYIKNRPARLAKMAEWSRNHREIANRLQKEVLLRLRKIVIEHYGGICKCCKEKDIKFLVIDHVNGGGNKHRKEIRKGGGGNFYRWLKNSFKYFCLCCQVV